MVVFSELAPFGPLTQHAQALPSAAEQSFQEMAARHGIWLLPGSMFEKVGESICNTASVIDPAGLIVGRYRKMFHFRPYEQGVETDDLLPGFVRVDQGGVVRLAKLQSEGYIYLRP